MHTCDDDLFGRFAGFLKSRAESLDDGITSKSGDGGHVQDVANAAAASANGAFALEESRVAVERGDADQCGELAVVDFPQLGQLGDERGSEHLSDARRAFERLGKRFPLIVGVDEIVDPLIEFCDLLLERGDDRVKSASGGHADRGGFAVDLFGCALDELPAACDKRGEFALDFQAFFKQPRRSELPEACQKMSVDGVGLGQNAKAPGEVADVAGVDQSHRQVGFQKSVKQGAFESSCGLDDDAGRRDRAEFFQECLDAVVIVGPSPGVFAVGASDVEEVFGDVDTYGGLCG